MARTARANLRRLLAPRHLAVFGGAAAEEAIRQSHGIGYTGEIWPLHPHRDTLGGLPCYRTVTELPEAPDAAFVAVPRDATVDVVAVLAAYGSGGAVCHASGFAEHGGDGVDLQRALVEAAGDMPVIGPNCIGVLNYLDGAALWPDQHGGHQVDRGVAVITQSGNIGQNLTMQRRSLPLAQLVTMGNGAVTGVPALMAAMLDDPRITAIGLHLEGPGDPVALCEVGLEALRRGVPIVALKSGRSTLGARANLSHTSSLSGSDALWNALFERVGIARVEQLETLVETLKFLHVHGPLAGRRLASASCSGGEAALVADLAEDRGLELPEFPEPTAQRLHDVLGDRVSVVNPLDYHTYIWGDRDALTDCFDAFFTADADAHVVVLDFPRADRCVPENWQAVMNAVLAAGHDTRAAVSIVSQLSEGLSEAAGQRLVDAGITPMQGLTDCLDAIAAAATIGAAQTKAADAVPLATPPGPVGTSLVQLDEWHGKQDLSGYGLPVPEGCVTGAADVASAAGRLGFPVVLKALSTSIAHKTDVGGVRVGLTDERQVRQAVGEMTGLTDTFLVERMLGGAVAELLVGVHRDPQFGLVVTVGVGGELVELLTDTAAVLLPTTRDEIAAALRSLRAWSMLAGFRGRPAADVAAAVDAVLAVVTYARAHQDTLVELEVNPLLVFAQGAAAVDVLVRHDETADVEARAS
ncbi:MAG: CoA-binding protein [Streptosporangiales bacterium]|nr:CoA-binding protein [Streptosporangiales bacterium]